MQDTDATTMTSRRSKRAAVALWRRRSISALMAASFSMKVSVWGDVRLRLIVVVVGDEVLHGVFREELPNSSHSWAASVLLWASTSVGRCTFSMTLAMV